MITFDVTTGRVVAPATTIIAAGTTGAASTPELGLQEAPLDGYLAPGERDPHGVAAHFAGNLPGMGANTEGVILLHSGLNPLEYIAAVRCARKAKNDYNELEKLLKMADQGNLFAISSVKKLDVSGFFKALDSRCDESLHVLLPLFQKAALYGNVQALAELFKVSEAETRDPKSMSTTVVDWVKKIALQEKFSPAFKEAIRKHPDMIKLKDGMLAFYTYASERVVIVGRSKFIDHLDAFASITGFDKGDLIKLDMKKAEASASLDGNLAAVKKLYLFNRFHGVSDGPKNPEFELHLRSIDPHMIVERLKTLVETRRAGDDQEAHELVSNEQALNILMLSGNQRARTAFIEYLDACEIFDRPRANMLMHTMGEKLALNHKRDFIADLVVAARNGSTMALEQIYYLLEKTVLRTDGDMPMFRSKLAAVDPAMIGKEIREIVDSGKVEMAKVLANKVEQLSHLAVEYRNDAALNELERSYPAAFLPALYERFNQLDGTEELNGVNRKFELFNKLIEKAHQGDVPALAYVGAITSSPNVAYGEYNYKQLSITYLADGMISDKVEHAGLLMLAVAENPNDEVLAARFKAALMNTKREVVLKGLTLFLQGRPFADEIRSLLNALKEYAWRGEA